MLYHQSDRARVTELCNMQMTYIQATQGGGGWPMNVFLTPGLEPFVGGTSLRAKGILVAYMYGILQFGRQLKY